jgi:hypothetical protein
MSRSKKIFALLGLCFVLAALLVTVDIMQRTSRPGKRKHLPSVIFKKHK